MFLVTWKFQGKKQSQKFASSAGADRRAEWLRRQGDCKLVKVAPIPGTTQGAPATFTEADGWAAIDADNAKRAGCTNDCFCNCNGSCRIVT